MYLATGPSFFGLFAFCCGLRTIHSNSAAECVKVRRPEICTIVWRRRAPANAPGTDYFRVLLNPLLECEWALRISSSDLPCLPRSRFKKEIHMESVQSPCRVIWYSAGNSSPSFQISAFRCSFPFASAGRLRWQRFAATPKTLSLICAKNRVGLADVVAPLNLRYSTLFGWNSLLIAARPFRAGPKALECNTERALVLPLPRWIRKFQFSPE